ncbi:MAG: type II toxin-antitoxin system VapC family toxin [Terracidiphilus sp.]
MRTAIDTNVISAIWSAEASAPRLSAQLGAASTDGALLICPAVFAELCAYPGATPAFLRKFLDTTGVTVDYRLEEAVWAEAGERFARYADRRRQSAGSSPRRLLTDFLVGAHALVQAERLLTLDPGIYRRNFPEVSLL